LILKRLSEFLFYNQIIPSTLHLQLKREGTVEAETPMKLSDGEKLIITMLCDIYKHFGIRGEVNPDFVKEAVIDGHYWGLKWEYSGLFSNHVDSEDVLSEVCDIMDMWMFLEDGYEALSESDKDLVKEQAAPFGTDVRFRGFDGNNEGEHLGIARFLIEKLNRFDRFKDRRLNSHWHSIDTYRRMLRPFEAIRRTLEGRELTAPEIIDILREMLHPEHRTT
jgi:uncharacterized protein